MSLANKVSVLRILLVPGIVASLLYYAPEREGLRIVALWLFLIGIATDAVDGFLARSQRQQSALGTILDPIADKLLILSTLISCSVIRGLPEWMRIPAWFNLVVISRDVLVVAGTLVLFVLQGRWTVRPSWMGKWATAAQMVVIPAILLGLPIKLPLLLLATGLTICSAIGYVRLGLRVLS